MCNLSEGIWERGLNEGREQGRQEGREQGRQEGREQGRQEGREQGRQEGIRIGEDRGEVKNLIKLVERNIITKEQAYEVTTLTPKEFDEQYAQWIKASKQQIKDYAANQLTTKNKNTQ